MTRFFPNNWRKIGALALSCTAVILFFIACSSGVKEITSLGWNVEIASGAEQITLPRRAFSNPVEIIVKNSSGQPVVDAAMEFRLVDQQLIGEAGITTEVLAKAWATESARLTSTDPAVRNAAAAEANAGRASNSKAEVSIEERVGRIDQFDPRTNREGRAKAWVIAPTIFDKAIAVLAKAGSDPNLSGSFSYALLRTSNYGDGARLYISTTNSKKEKAGDEFDIYLSIADVEGRIASSYNETKKVKIEATPKTSWAGVKPEFPSGELECRFSGGMCLLPRGPYILRVPEEVNVTITVIDSKVPVLNDKIMVTNDIEKAFIALKGVPGQPSENDTIIDKLKIVAGRTTDLYAAWIDRSGNFLEDVTNATWSIDSARLSEGLSSSSGKSITFAPTKTGSGFLTVTSDNKSLLKLLPVVVPANEVHAWRFRINGEEPATDASGTIIPPTVKAKTCVDVDLFAADVYGNIAPTVDGEHFITLKIENADTGVVLSSDAHWGELQPDDHELTDFKVTLNEGVAKNVERACFYDATFSEAEGKPKITAVGKVNTDPDKIFTGSMELNIEKNLPRRIVLTRAEGNYSNYTDDNAINVCTRETQELGSKPCLVMQAQTAEDFKAALVDGAGNFLKYVDVIVTDESAKLAVTSSTVNGVQRYRLSPTNTGSGRLQVEYDESSGNLTPLEKTQVGASNLSIKYDYSIVASAPFGVVTQLDTNNDNRFDGSDNYDSTLKEPFVVAGQTFKVIGRLVDENGDYVEQKRILVTSNRHISQSYYLVSPLNDTVSIEEARFTSDAVLCHRKQANALVPQEHIDTKDDQSNKSASLVGGIIKFVNPTDTFRLMRATNAYNGNCATSLTLRVKIGNSSAVLSTPGSNTVTVRAKPVVSALKYQNEENNAGIDLNETPTCNNNSASYINDFCHEIILGGTFRQLHIAAFDEYKNYLTSANANTDVKFTWVNTPSLENYNSFSSLAQYNIALAGSSADVNYLLKHASNLTTGAADPLQDDIDTKIRIGIGQAAAVEVDGLSPAGSGYMLAELVGTPTVKVQSKVYNFLSDVARKYIIDFIEPNEVANPQVYWSSADGPAVGNASSGRQIPAGIPFAIRLRPVDNGNNPIKTYRDTKNLRISIPENSSWGAPTLLSLQAIDKNTPLNGTTIFDFDCDFQVPSVLKYTETLLKIGGNYTVNGPYPGGTECIVKNGGSIRQFSLVNSRFQYTLIVSDNNPSTTLSGPTLATVQPIANTLGAKKIHAASKCGGPDAGAKLWFLDQTGITESTNDNSVKKIGTNKYQMTADEFLEFYPVLTDLSGNHIQDVDVSTPATLTESNAGSPSNSIVSNAATDCPTSQKISFEANASTSHLMNPTQTLTFSHTAVTNPAYQLQIPLEILPGKPSSLDVKLVEPRLTSSTPETALTVDTSTNTIPVTAGSCFSPSAKLMDSDGNQVRTFGGAVVANFGLENYYDTDSVRLKQKELIHPGGLYRYRSLGNLYLPITSLEAGQHDESSVVPDSTGNPWLSPLSYTHPSAMDGVSVSYRGSERSNRIIIAGELDLNGRYVCLMDATPGLEPNLKVAVNLNPAGTPAWIYGESKTAQDIRVNAGPPSVADYRQIVAGEQLRLCHHPTSRTGFPVYQLINQEPGFAQVVDFECRSLGVSNSDVVIETYFTDSVGNTVAVGSHSAGTPVGSWAVSSVPPGTEVCGLPEGNGTTCTGAAVTLANVVKKGTLTLNWNLPSGLSDTYGLRELNIAVKSGPPENFTAISNLASPTSDNTFGFNIKLLDGFGNDFDPQPGFTYAVVANISYTGIYGSPATFASPNASDPKPNLMPPSVNLLFNKSNTAPTANSFRFRRANGVDLGGITFSLKPSASTPTTSNSFPLTILPGNPVQNDVFFSDTSGPNMNVALISLDADPVSQTVLTSGPGSQQFEVRSLDEAGNVAVSPPVNFVYSGTTNLPPFVPVPSVLQAASLSLARSGVGTFRATLTNNPSISTPLYKIVVAPADASKLMLIRVMADGTPFGTSTPVTAGNFIYFKIVATDDLDNIVDQFNHNNVTVQWNYDRYPARPEGIRARLPGCASDNCAAPVIMTNACEFVAGVCRTGPNATDPIKIFEAKLYGSTGSASASLEATANVNSGYSGSISVVVNPSTFHHFGVIPDITDVEARSDKSTTFTANVEARDEFGNKITGPQLDPLRSTQIKLHLRRDDGITAASGSLANMPNTLPTFGASADSVSFSGLAYDEPGVFRILASKSDDTAMSTLEAAPLITFRPVEATIFKYRLVFLDGSNDFTAGQQYTFRLEAVDNYLNPIRGIDNILRTHQYQWAGLFNSEPIFGVSRPADVMPTQFDNLITGQFRDGVALFKGTLYKAADNYLSTLLLTNKKTTPSDTSDDTVVENFAPTAVTAIRVLPNQLSKYNVIVTANSEGGLTSLAASSNLAASSEMAGKFRIVVQPIDNYGNLRIGEAGIFLTPDKGSNTLNSSVARKDGDSGFAVLPLNLVTGMTPGVGFVFQNLYYRVAQPVNWTLSGTSGSVTIVPSVTVNYQATKATVENYKMFFNGSNVATSIEAGVNFFLTLKALDEVGNIVSGTGIGAALSSSTFTATGPESIQSFHPTSLTSFAFNDSGEATKANVQFFKAQNFLPGTFVVSEDSSTRKATNENALTIIPGTVSNLEIEPLPSQKAGSTFTTTAWALDAYSNPSNTGCADPSGNNTYPINVKGVLADGTTPDALTSSGDGGGTATPAFTNPATGININQVAASKAVYQQSLTLYKKGENKLLFSGCGRTTLVTLIVNESDKANAVRLNNSPAAPAVSLSTDQECNHTNTTDSNVVCPTIYAFMWDEYGNVWRDGEGSCTWSYTNLVPSSPLSVTAAVTGLVSNSASQTLLSNKHMSGNLRCSVVASDSATNAPIHADVKLYGGLAGLGGRDGSGNLLTTNISTFPAVFGAGNPIAVGSNNLRITKITLLQYRGGTINADGSVATFADPAATSRTRTEEYSFTHTGTIDPTLLPTNLVRNHTITGDLDGEFIMSLNRAMQGNITVAARGVESTLNNVVVGVGAPSTIRIGRFMVGGTETQSVTAGDLITLESVRVYDGMGNLVCNGSNDAVIEASELMTPAVCGTDLTCNTLDSTLPGAKPADFDTYALNSASNQRSFAHTASGEWNNLQFKLYRSSLAFRLTVRACGLSSDHVFGVSPAQLAHARLSASETAPAATTLMPEIKCPLGEGLGVRCPTINGFYWDNFGNRYTSGSCTSWSYERTNINSVQAGSGTGDFALAANNTNKTSITTDNLKYLSGRLTCQVAAGVNAEALIYGGLTSITATHTFGSGTQDVAAENNFTVTSVTAKFKKPSVGVGGVLSETEEVKDDFTPGLNENIMFGTTAGSLTTPILPIASNSTTFSCAFNNSGMCSPTGPNAKLSFRKVEAARTITLSLRGKAFEISGLVATPNKAHSIEAGLYQDTGVENTKITATSAMTAGTSVGAIVRVYDEFMNPTSKYGTSLTECAVGDTDIQGVDSEGNPLSAPSRLTSADRRLTKISDGVYKIEHNTNFGAAGVGLTMTKADTHTITFTLCGQTTSSEAKVIPATHTHTRVTLSATPPTNPQTVTPIHHRCTLNVNGSGATCDATYAWFYDNYFNRIESLTCPSWAYAVRDTADDSVLANVQLSLTGGSSSTRVTSTDFMDGDLTCDFSGTAQDASVHLYGGIHSLEVAHNLAGASVKAGTSNVTISQLILKGPSYDGTGGYSLSPYPVALPNTPVTISSTATAASVDTAPNVVTPSFTCNFDTNGTCSSPNTANAFQMNFTKAQSAISFTVEVRGKTYPQGTTFNVTPANANAAQSTITVLDPSNNPRPTNAFSADETIGLDILTKDEFGNATEMNSNDANNCATSTTIGGTSGIGNNGLGSSGFGAPSSNNKHPITTGSYQIRGMRISTPGSYALTFTTCAFTKTVNFNVTPGAAEKFSLNLSGTQSKSSVDVSPCATITEGGGASCATVYAYFYDQFENHRANDTCENWTLTAKSVNTSNPWNTQAASASVQVTSQSALDATLNCTKLNSSGTQLTEMGGTAGIHLHGGFMHLTVAATDVRDGSGFMTASADNLTIDSITMRSYVNGALTTPTYSGTFLIKYSTTASGAPNGTPFTTSPEVNCSFSSGVCSTSKSFTFAKADTANQTLFISVKGVNTISTTEGDGAKLTTIKVKPNTPTSHTTTLPSQVMSTDSFGGEIRLFDTFSNPSCDAASLTYTAPSSTESPNGTTATSGAANNTATGVYSISSTSFTLPKVSATGYNLQFAGCGYTVAHNVQVREGALASIKLLDNTTTRTESQVHSATELSGVTCRHTATSGAGVVCDAIKAHLLDAKGNFVNDPNKQCAWIYSATTLTGSATTPPTLQSTAPANLPEGRVLTIGHTGYLDGTVKCQVGGGTVLNSAVIPVKGGVSRVALAMVSSSASNISSTSSAADRTLSAANDNVGVYSVTLYTRAAGAELAATGSDYTSASEPVEFVTTAVKSVMNAANPVVPSNPTCDFTGGLCGGGTTTFATASIKLSLTRAGAAGANDVALKVRGVLSNSISMIVNADAATNATIDPISPQTAGTAFNVYIRGFDTYGNQSLRNCTNFTMSGGLTSANSNAPTFTGTTGGFDNTTDTTLPGASVTLFAKGNHPLTFSGTGCSITATTTVSVNAAAADNSKTIMSTADAATVADVPTWQANSEATPTELACTTLNTGGDTGVTCPTLYSYKYDAYGNTTALTAADITGQTCNWQVKTHGAASWAAWVSSARQATRISNSTTPAVDELVKCDGGANYYRLYGGPAALVVVTFPSSTLTSGKYVVSGSQLLAGFSNFTLSAVALRSKKEGVDVAMPGLSGVNNLEITLTNVTMSGNTFGANSSSTTTSTVYESSITGCLFNNNGRCFPSSSMNFKKLESTASDFKVAVRGVEAVITIPQVVPGPAAGLDILNLPSTFNVDSYTSASTTIDVTVNPKDQFGNVTTSPVTGTSGCDLTVTGNEQGIYPDSINAGTQPSSLVKLKIYKAKTHTLTFSKCGVSKAANIEIQAGVARRSMITQNDVPPNFSCYSAGDSIDTNKTSCSGDFSLTCNAQTTAGGSACGTFYAWKFDKAGNILNGDVADSKDCSGADVDSGALFAGNTGSGTASKTTVSTGFQITASTSGTWLDGTLKCSTIDGSGSNFLGGQKVTVIAKVLLDPPNVECTPWIYLADERANSSNTSSTPVSLCQFTNTLAHSLTFSSASTDVVIASAEADNEAATALWKSWSTYPKTFATNSIGQFIIQGENAKFSTKFKINPGIPATHTGRISLSERYFRVPTRDLITATNTTAGQKTALEAGVNPLYAEIAEDNSNAARNLIYYGSSTEIIRRAALSVANTSTSQPGMFIYNGTSGTTLWNLCDSNARRCSDTTKFLSTYDIFGNPANFPAASSGRFVVHPLTSFFLTQTTGTCDDNVAFNEQTASACSIALKYDVNAAYTGLRGVFMLRDSNGYYFYHMTQPIP